jgi:CRISP-associated protein Cas1
VPANAANFDKVIIQGKGYVSTEALERLAASNINVIMLDKRGKLYSYFHQNAGHEPLIRQNHYDCIRNQKKVEYLRKWIISEKIESQMRLFEELSVEPYDENNDYKPNNANHSARIPYKVRERIRKSLDEMKIHYVKLEAAHSLREIMKIEGDVGELYYPTFAHVFRPELGFNSRNNRRTYRSADAADVINGLLNYGFSILYAEVAKEPNALGLDCSVGFYHTNKNRAWPWYMI